MSGHHTDQITKVMQMFMEQNTAQIEASKQEQIARETRIFLLQAKVNPYSGNSSPKRIKRFKEDVVSICEGINLDDSQLIIAAGRNMTDQAEEWYQERRTSGINESFNEFFEAAEYRFAKEHNSIQVYQQLIQLKHKGSAAGYNARFQKLLAGIPKLESADHSIIGIYINNLRYKVKREVEWRNPGNLVEAMRTAVLFDDRENSYQNYPRKFKK